MPSDKYKKYDPDKKYDIGAQIQRAERNGETRAQNYEQKGDRIKAARARADAALTVQEWRDGSHPALKASRHH